jgi:hypothetical protein
MTPGISWIAIGLGLLVLYLLVFRPWPHEVRDNEVGATVAWPTPSPGLADATVRAGIYDWQADGSFGDAA